MASPSPDDLSTRTSPAQVWSPQDIRALGATTDLLTAASVLRIGRTKAYHLAAAGRFPVPVVRTGRRYVVAVGHLLHVLGLDTSPGG
jgi:hypothetical protein